MLHAINVLPPRSHHQPCHGHGGNDLQPLLTSQDPSKVTSLTEEASLGETSEDSQSISDSSKSCVGKKVRKGNALASRMKAQRSGLFKNKFRYRCLEEPSILADDYDAFLFRNVSRKKAISKIDCDESVSMAAMSEWTGGSACYNKGSPTVMCLSTDNDGMSIFDEMSAIYSYNASSLVSKDTYHLCNDVNANDESFDLSTLATLSPNDEEHTIVGTRDHHYSVAGRNEALSNSTLPTTNGINRSIIILGITDDTSTMVFPSSIIHQSFVGHRKRRGILRTALNCLRRIIMDPLPHKTWYHQSTKWEI
jgi:hypothetical protein